MPMSQLLFPQGLLPLVWRPMGSTFFGPLHLHLHNIGGPKRGGGDSAGDAPSHRSLWGHCFPLGKLSASDSTARGPPIPCHIPQLTNPTGSFKQVNLKGSGKMYLCKQCKKQTSNWDSLVFHCLQEHLGIHLISPQCRMSYSDPSKFAAMAGGSIICCFIKTLKFLNLHWIN